MKSATRIKTHRDHQGLLRDIGFLLLAVGFVLVKGFDQPLDDAALYAPLIVAGSFTVLVGGAYLLIGLWRLLEALAERLGLDRGPRY